MERAACRQLLLEAGLDTAAAVAWTEQIAVLGCLRSRGWSREAGASATGEWTLRFPGLGLGAAQPVLAPALLHDLLRDPPDMNLAPPTAHDRAQVASRLVPRLTGRPRVIRVFDSICGDGARLEAAFDRLVAWHWEAAGAPPDLEATRRLACRCLHGLDPDATQVHRARLRLGLRALDGAAPDEVVRSVTLFASGLLPDLSVNLRLGADPQEIAGGYDVVLRG